MKFYNIETDLRNTLKDNDIKESTYKSVIRYFRDGVIDTLDYNTAVRLKDGDYNVCMFFGKEVKKFSNVVESIMDNLLSAGNRMCKNSFSSVYMNNGLCFELIKKDYYIEIYIKYGLWGNPCIDIPLSVIKDDCVGEYIKHFRGDKPSDSFINNLENGTVYMYDLTIQDLLFLDEIYEVLTKYIPDIILNDFYLQEENKNSKVNSWEFLITGNFNSDTSKHRYIGANNDYIKNRWNNIFSDNLKGYRQVFALV